MKSLLLVAPALIAAVLAILLIWDPRFMTKEAYRLLFFLALGAFAIVIMRPGPVLIFIRQVRLTLHS